MPRGVPKSGKRKPRVGGPSRAKRVGTGLKKAGNASVTARGYKVKPGMGKKNAAAQVAATGLATAGGWRTGSGQRGGKRMMAAGIVASGAATKRYQTKKTTAAKPRKKK